MAEEVPVCSDQIELSRACECRGSICLGYKACTSFGCTAESMCGAAAETSCATACVCTTSRLGGHLCAGTNKKCVQGEIQEFTNPDDLCTARDLLSRVCKCSLNDLAYCPAGKLCRNSQCAIPPQCSDFDRSGCQSICSCAKNKITGELCDQRSLKCVNGEVQDINTPEEACKSKNLATDVCKCNLNDEQYCRGDRVCLNGRCSAELVCGAAAETNCAAACICAINKLSGLLCSNPYKKCIKGEIQDVIAPEEVCTNKDFLSAACKCQASDPAYCPAGKLCQNNYCATPSPCSYTEKTGCTPPCICAKNKITGTFCEGINYKCVNGEIRHITIPEEPCQPDYSLDAVCKCRLSDSSFCSAYMVCLNEGCSTKPVCEAAAEISCETPCICATDKVTGSLCSGAAKKCVDGQIIALYEGTNCSLCAGNDSNGCAECASLKNQKVTNSQPANKSLFGEATTFVVIAVLVVVAAVACAAYFLIQRKMKTQKHDADDEVDRRDSEEEKHEEVQEVVAVEFGAE